MRDMNPYENERLVDTKEVCRRTCLSRTSIWAMEKDGTFPRATRIGRAVRWRPSEVNAWIRERSGAAPQPDGDSGKTNAPSTA